MDFDVPEDLREILEVTRHFASTDLREAEVELDRYQDPLEAFTSETHRAITKKMFALGLHKLTLPSGVGGLGLPRLAKFLVEEELAAGGAGLASQMLVTSIAAVMIANWGLADRHPAFREYLEAYVEDDEGTHSSAWTVTEPDVGSDIFTFNTPGVRFQAKATTGKGGYIINGAKSAWCTNGWLADFLVAMVNVEPDAEMDGSGTFLIPANWPGVAKGRPIDKLGLRALNQCEIVFDNVEVPREFLVFPPEAGYRGLLDAFVTAGNTSVGNIALGVARRAYELGLSYAKERRQGGKVIIEHQIVAKKLFDAFRHIEAARLALRRSAWLINENRGQPHLAFAARVQACEVCRLVTADMMLLHGGNGITREYPIEKLYRDAGPLQVMDGTVDRVALKGAAYLGTEGI